MCVERVYLRKEAVYLRKRLCVQVVVGPPVLTYSGGGEALSRNTLPIQNQPCLCPELPLYPSTCNNDVIALYKRSSVMEFPKRIFECSFITCPPPSAPHPTPPTHSKRKQLTREAVKGHGDLRGAWVGAFEAEEDATALGLLQSRPGVWFLFVYIQFYLACYAGSLTYDSTRKNEKGKRKKEKETSSTSHRGDMPP